MGDTRMSIDISDLSEEELGQLITQCLERRAEMAPTYPDMPPMPLNAFIDPKWYCHSVPEGTVLSILHPGAGWLSYLIPVHERANLLSLLLRQALTPTTSVK